MHVSVLTSPRATAAALAQLFADAIRQRPALVVGLPTGRTPVPFYAALVALHRLGRVDLSGVTVFAVDEFLGLPSGHPGTCAAFLQRHLLRHVNIPPKAVNIPRSAAPDPRKEARRYEAAIAAAGGLDLVLLGIGANGHIGFNEPGASLRSETHVARLRPATRRANAGQFGGEWRRVPAQGISMGVGTLLRARRVVLVATGSAKSRIIRRALEGPVTTRVPASLLQTHPDAVVLLDRAAASRLT
jgi:glucosamine-6-phosphate deaminase